MKYYLSLFFISLAAPALAQSAGPGPTQPREKTAFQTSSPWIPEIDTRSDMAIVYGVNDRKGSTFEQRVQSWRDRGYQTAFMTGIAWGQYYDYFLGQWDGQNHLGIGQVTQKGDTIFHGRNMPYVVPVQSFIEYMKTAVVKRVIDAGINTIFLEEPEFWARAGYSAPFKEEWQKFYGFPWRPQDASPENTYLSSKLKYQLYYNAIKQVSDYAKDYAKQKGVAVKVYIATHSLVNYSSWKIVSPEASLASLPGIDGYIAQVWTGTSREPTYFDGKEKERVFENAYLEYGSMLSMTAPTGRKVYFLTDPIEDWPRDWADYKKNYQATFTAEILYPTIDNYEVMPWPERIYTRPYKLAHSDSTVLIPRYYSTQMQVMINVLNDMPGSANSISGNGDIGVLMSNSLMFQRFPTHNGYDDPQFSNFYGQTLPLVKRGIPVQTVHMENLAYPSTLAKIRVLIMSYSNMKPQSPDAHRYLADWVRRGGVLVYCGQDVDPYQSVMEWWNTKGNHFTAPSQHLFQLLGIAARPGTAPSSPGTPTLPAPGDLIPPAPGTPTTPVQRFTVGKGAVYILRQDPKAFVLQPGGDAQFFATVKQAYTHDAHGGELLTKNSFYLERGPYDIISVLDENADTKPFTVHGPVIDLFDPHLPVLAGKTVSPGEQSLLYDLARVPDRSQPRVLASASRIYQPRTATAEFSFVAKSPVNTDNSVRVLLPEKPVAITVTDPNGQPVPGVQSSWDASSNTEWLGFANSPDGINVDLKW